MRLVQGFAARLQRRSGQAGTQHLRTESPLRSIGFAGLGASRLALDPLAAHPRSMALSPWSPGESLASPDGTRVASIPEAYEIAMGAPTSGDLTVAGLVLPGCNPSMVWSDDSAYLAVPQWTAQRSQRLLIVSIDRKEFCLAPKIYRVLELHTFRNGVVSGLDSPIHMTTQLRFAIADFGWS